MTASYLSSRSPLASDVYVSVHLDSPGWPLQIANESSQKAFCRQYLLARRPEAHFTRQHVGDKSPSIKRGRKVNLQDLI